MFGKIDERKIKDMWDLLCVGASKDEARTLMSPEDFNLYVLLYEEFDEIVAELTSSHTKRLTH